MMTYKEPTRLDRAWGTNQWVRATYISANSFSVPGNAVLEVGTGVQVLNNGVLRQGYVVTANFASNITTIVLEGNTNLTNSANTMARFGGAAINSHLGKLHTHVDVQNTFTARGDSYFAVGSSTSVAGTWVFNTIPTFNGGVTGIEGGEFRISAGASGNSIAGGSVTVDVSGNYIRFFETGGTNRGMRIDITSGLVSATAEVWHTGNFDPATKVSVAGDVMTGILSHYSGTPGVQRMWQRYGWSNALQRWAWVGESNAGFSLYSYDATGSSGIRTLNIRTTAAGGSNVLTFLDQTVWYAGNLDPTAFLVKAGDTASGQIAFTGSVTTTVASATTGLGSIMLSATGSNVAMMSFHRSGSFACYLGLHTDNNLHVGGWSHGANSWKLWHAGAGALATASAITGGSLTATAGAAIGTTLTVGGATTMTGNLTVNGVLTTVQYLTANQHVSGVTATFSGIVNGGGVYSSGQIYTAAELVAGTYVSTVRWLFVGGSGGHGGQTSQGSYMTWNHNSGLGETGFFNNRGGGAGGFDFYYGTGGSYTRIARILGNGDFQSLSDASLKENFSALRVSEALAFINNVDAGFYNWKRDGLADIGFLADDVENWTQRLVKKDHVGIRSLAYQKISTYHHTAIKYVVSEVELLRSEVNTLKEQVASLMGGA